MQIPEKSTQYSNRVFALSCLPSLLSTYYCSYRSQHKDNKNTKVFSLSRGIDVSLPPFFTRLEHDGATQRHNLSLSPVITLLILRYGLSSAGLSICHNCVIETTGIQKKIYEEKKRWRFGHFQFYFPISCNDQKMTCAT